MSLMIWPLIKRWRLEEYIVFGFFWWLYNAAKRAHLSFSRISEAGKVGLCLWTAGYHLDVVVKLVRLSDPLELCRLGPWSLAGSTLPDWWRSTVQTENNLSFLPVAGWAWDQSPLLVKKKQQITETLRPYFSRREKDMMMMSLSRFWCTTTNVFCYTKSRKMR